jgi:hypothetical protein
MSKNSDTFHKKSVNSLIIHNRLKNSLVTIVALEGYFSLFHCVLYRTARVIQMEAVSKLAQMLSTTELNKALDQLILINVP